MQYEECENGECDHVQEFTKMKRCDLTKDNVHNP